MSNSITITNTRTGKSVEVDLSWVSVLRGETQKPEESSQPKQSAAPDFEFDYEGRHIKFWNKNPVVLCRHGDTYPFYGYAVCQLGDRFDLFTGMKIALGRAVDGVTRAERHIAALESAWKKHNDNRNCKCVVEPTPFENAIDRFAETIRKLNNVQFCGIDRAGFVADGRTFFYSDGWKQPEKEMPDNYGWPIEFVYKNDKNVYRGFWGRSTGARGSHFCTYYTVSLDEDYRRSPDVIAWRPIK